MKNLRKRFDRFCYRNQSKGIPNLMLYICLGSALVYLTTLATQNPVLLEILSFDRSKILHGQIWRLFTYPIAFFHNNLFLALIALVCYYSLGNAVERAWGTLKFNLFYLTGVVLMDIYCLIFGGWASVSFLNLSMVLAFATLYPESQFLIFFFIPIRAWVLALVYLVIAVMGLITYRFPDNLFSIVSLANYFLFFGKDVINLLPFSWRAKMNQRFKGGKSHKKAKTIPFNPAPGNSSQTEKGSGKVPYTHKCTVCGRTDVSNPELEFRYCSRCNGYYCYCQDHINNHVHIK